MTPAAQTPHSSELERAACPQCGAGAGSPVVTAGDRLGADGRRYTVVRCSECGIAYLADRPTPQTIGDYYPSCYTGGGRRGAVYTVEAFYRRRQHSEVVRWLGMRRPERGRLLDVGCGSGDLLAALRADGWRVHGVEPSPSGAEQARAVHGLDVLTGRFEEIDPPPAAFDAVVFAGVLEHIHDPLSALRRAGDLLAPGGLIAVLFLPLLDSPQATIFGPRWLALDLPRHLTHFEDATLRSMAAAAGLVVVGRETYSRRHSAAQLVGSVVPSLQKHRFYAAEARGGPCRPADRIAPLARRGAYLLATVAARPVARLEAALGRAALSSYFLESAPPGDGERD